MAALRRRDATRAVHEFNILRRTNAVELGAELLGLFANILGRQKSITIVHR